ncbi:MAG: hypothetical protein ABI867_27485 [Kofleriaceae bacterium]
MRWLFAAVLLGGCTLYEYNAGDDSPPGTPDGGTTTGGPIGRLFFVERSLGSSPSTMCPPFSQQDLSHNVDVVATSSVRVDGMPASSVTVRNTPAREGQDGPNVLFTINETWDSPDGLAMPALHYTMFVDQSQFTGSANAVFGFNSPDGPTTCSYNWTFSGFSD